MVGKGGWGTFSPSHLMALLRGIVLISPELLEGREGRVGGETQAGLCWWRESRKTEYTSLYDVLITAEKDCVVLHC